MKTNRDRTTNTSGWILAVKLLKRYLLKPTKADVLLSDLPDNISSTDRRYCQFLFFGVIRHKSLIESIINKMLMKKPRIGLKALLMIAVYEIMEMEKEKLPKIIDFSVENAKQLLSLAEAKLINAVLRKVPEEIESTKKDNVQTVENLAVKYSHPKWLITRWIKEFGLEKTNTLLEWNQLIPLVYLRIENEINANKFEPTQWKGFYSIRSENWKDVEELIRKGNAYIQDPSTRIGPELAEIVGNETILDLCAAPGGKSIMMANKLNSQQGQLVAVDLPGKRIDRLKENLKKLKDIKYTILETDIRELSLNYFKNQNLPTQYDVVLLDAPCSNTGTLRRRVDAKWRLKEGDIELMAELQLELLERVALFVKPGGKLIYSTCSIEEEENKEVVKHFLEKCKGEFACIRSLVSYPWEEGCDGGGAFLLLRKK